MVKIKIVRVGASTEEYEIPNNTSIRSLLHMQEIFNGKKYPNIISQIEKEEIALIFKGKKLKLNDKINETGVLIIGSKCVGNASLSEKDLINLQVLLRRCKEYIQNASNSNNNSIDELVKTIDDYSISRINKALNEMDKIFSWNGTPENREKVYCYLLRKGYLRESFGVFCSRFMTVKESISPDCSPLNWRGQEQQLAEFLHSLISLDQINPEPSLQEGARASHVFLVKNQDVNLSSSLSRYRKKYMHSLIYKELKNIVEK